MAKICFLHHTCGEFSSLNEAFRYLKKREYGWSWYTLTEIVKCNVYYRDYLREHGVNSLIEKIIDEVPELAGDDKALKHLREWAIKEKVAIYDIQCYNIKDRITVLGHTFDGLEDVIKHRELIGKEFMRGFDCFTPQNVNVYSGIHIGELYENYPIFDSYDLGDDRTYQNYIFRKDKINRQDMETAFSVYRKGNFCMVHEQIPEDFLPILYYSGDGKYMLLASAKV